MSYDTRKPDSQPFKCGLCAYFKDRQVFEKPCQQMGADNQDDICTKFTFDISRWPAKKRMAIVHAVNQLYDAGMSVTDMQAVFYTAKRLSGKTPLGSRWTYVFGNSPYVRRILITAWAAGSGGKTTYVSDTGAVVNVSAHGLKPYIPSEPDDTLFAPVDLLPPPEERKTAKEQLAETDQKIRTYVLRGDPDDEPVADTPAPEAPRKRGRPPKDPNAVKPVKPVKPVKSASKPKPTSINPVAKRKVGRPAKIK